MLSVRYFPAPYANNQLICSLRGPKQSHAFDSAGSKQQLGLVVGRPTSAISPKEYTRDNLRSKIQPGACPQTPLAGALRAL